MAEKPYTRVYHRLMTEYPSVYRSPAQLGLWLQLLILAEKFYPDPAPVPHKTRTYRELVAVGLVQEQASTGYTIKGLEAERERRAESGRIGARMRWHSDRNADPMLDKTRQEKTRREGGNGIAPTAIHAGPIHDGRHENCVVCAPLREAKS